jgi:hypothetical protein
VVLLLTLNVTAVTDLRATGSVEILFQIPYLLTTVSVC